MALTKAGILAASDITTETVKVPEWGGDVLVRGLTGSQRDAYEEGCYVGQGKDRRTSFKNLRARLVALCVVDEQGARVFDDADAAALGDKSAAALDRIFDVAQRLSGLTAKDVEALAGN